MIPNFHFLHGLGLVKNYNEHIIQILAFCNERSFDQIKSLVGTVQTFTSGKSKIISYSHNDVGGKTENVVLTFYQKNINNNTYYIKVKKHPFINYGTYQSWTYLVNEIQPTTDHYDL